MVYGFQNPYSWSPWLGQMGQGNPFLRQTSLPQNQQMLMNPYYRALISAILGKTLGGNTPEWRLGKNV